MSEDLKYIEIDESQEIHLNILNKVMDALENDKYKYRTIKGLCNDTNFSEEEVYKILNHLSASKNLIIQSTYITEGGETLYTTRNHLKKKSTIWQRICASIKGTVD